VIMDCRDKPANDKEAMSSLAGMEPVAAIASG
jgi:hypothetical protein